MTLVYFVICLETALPMLLADPPQNMIAQSQSGTGWKIIYILGSRSNSV